MVLLADLTADLARYYVERALDQAIIIGVSAPIDPQTTSGAINTTLLCAVNWMEDIRAQWRGEP